MQQKFTVIIDTKKAYQPTQADISRILCAEVRKRIDALEPDKLGNFSVQIMPHKSGE
jgi:hypothetical protein